MSPTEPTLFHLPPPPAVPRAPRFAAIKQALWTHQKAQLIANYLRLFTMITKHGAYIDGFAGPQAPGQPKSWSAELALANQPPWLRQFFLCDANATQVARLNALKAQQPPIGNRTIEVYTGDFNRVIDRILSDGGIRPKTATFALLDQRTFECEWDSVRKLAQHKPAGELKIELFYFLPTGWFDRAVSGLKDRASALRTWWGRDDWQAYVTAKPIERPDLMTKRFRTELGYAFAYAWPIRSREHHGRLMYAMIHASDHEEAPKLMQRAYRLATAPSDKIEQLEIEYGLRS